MKKIFLFVACASLMVMGAQAQTAEELFKAGKAEFDKYDKLFGEYTLAHGQNPDAPDATLAERSAALMTGFDLLQKALPLDTVIEVNKDGTPKIDKKIIKLLRLANCTHRNRIHTIHKPLTCFYIIYIPRHRIA